MPRKHDVVQAILDGKASIAEEKAKRDSELRVEVYLFTAQDRIDNRRGLSRDEQIAALRALIEYIQTVSLIDASAPDETKPAEKSKRRK